MLNISVDNKRYNYDYCKLHAYKWDCNLLIFQDCDHPSNYIFPPKNSTRLRCFLESFKPFKPFIWIHLSGLNYLLLYTVLLLSPIKFKRKHYSQFPPQYHFCPLTNFNVPYCGSHNCTLSHFHNSSRLTVSFYQYGSTYKRLYKRSMILFQIAAAF